jgi:hypothetical protein
VCLVHVYLGAPVAEARAAAAAAEAETGVVCVHPERLREGRWGAAGQAYFELTLGPGNAQVPLEEWVRGWHALLARLGAGGGSSHGGGGS